MRRGLHRSSPVPCFAVFQYCRVIGGTQTPVYEVTLENVRVAKAEVRTIDTSGTSDPLAQQPVEEVELVAAKTTWQEGTEEAVYDKRSGRLSWAIGRTETGAQ